MTATRTPGVPVIEDGQLVSTNPVSGAEVGRFPVAGPAEVAAGRAFCTAALTSAGPATGNRPTSSPLAGLVEINSPSSITGTPGVRVAVMKRV